MRLLAALISAPRSALVLNPWSAEFEGRSRKARAATSSVKELTAWTKCSERKPGGIAPSPLELDKK